MGELATAVGAGIIIETLKLLSPYLPGLVGLGSQTDDAHTQWMKLAGNKRIEDLISAKHQLQNEKQHLTERLTELEKLSLTSGYTSTLREYITTPLEEKVDLLRNALLNGLYGDFDQHMREQLFRWVQALQPPDIKILEYLYERCPSLESLNNHSLRVDLSLGLVLSGDHRHGTPPSEGGLSKFCRDKDIDEGIARLSINRLQSQGLIFNPTAGWGLDSPYQGCVPLDGAKLLLDFVKDPK